MNLLKGRLRLEPDKYGEIRLRVLARDGWQCQFCGRRTNLEVHHQTFRSNCGSDSEENLITLCYSCHSAIHRKSNRVVNF